MDIALHLGVHLTDDSQIRKCLEANRRILGAAGVLVPRPGRYVRLMRNTANEIAQGGESPGFDETLFQSVKAGETTQRIVLSAPGLMSKLPLTCDGQSFYPGTQGRMAAYRMLLAGHDTAIFLAIRNPASFVPALLRELKDFEQAEILQNLRPEDLRWSRLVEDIRSAWPEAPITLWCDEDTPFIWHRLLRLVSGHDPDTEFEDSFAWFDSVMKPGGSEKLATYLDATPPVDEAHRQQIISAFLDKYCDAAKLDVDVSAAGWDEAQVDALSELYENDIEQIRQMDGVRVIQP